MITPRVVLAEELMEENGRPLNNVRVFVFGGSAALIQVRNFSHIHEIKAQQFLWPNGTVVGLKILEQQDQSLTKVWLPVQRVVSYAEKLARITPTTNEFVAVDFHVGLTKLVFGEFTFSPRDGGDYCRGAANLFRSLWP
eukprot:NODE_4512_length_654_cov_15.783471_g3860_i0.p1 GENE.NODE_4512_length_654_cov_15.783471_g3860_i0~~NODE_4512_length_654_cov_15.783471_g3860_i0.p1  ORF type:complete len:139 (+),score=33.31 NODE_4512_length_654_cov_15.783471_g3860_i0:97-513(+)